MYVCVCPFDRKFSDVCSSTRALNISADNILCTKRTRVSREFFLFHQCQQPETTCRRSFLAHANVWVDTYGCLSLRKRKSRVSYPSEKDRDREKNISSRGLSGALCHQVGTLYKSLRSA